MSARKDVELWFDLHQLAVQYWADVNQNFGKRAHEFYVEDGVFLIGENRHAGRKSIQNFYTWRETRGARVARHLLTNVRVESRTGNDEAALKGSICLFAADGVPVFESKPPTMVADFEAVCLRGTDQKWRFKSHVVTPLFRGEGRLKSPSAA